MKYGDCEVWVNVVVVLFSFFIKIIMNKVFIGSLIDVIFVFVKFLIEGIMWGKKDVVSVIFDFVICYENKVIVVWVGVILFFVDLFFDEK